LEAEAQGKALKKELAEGKKTNSKEKKQKVKPHLISSGKPDLKVMDYVPRNIIHIMCPSKLCGREFDS